MLYLANYSLVYLSRPLLLVNNIPIFHDDIKRITVDIIYTGISYIAMSCDNYSFSTKIVRTWHGGNGVSITKLLRIL